jgi:hypothetical protein
MGLMRILLALSAGCEAHNQYETEYFVPEDIQN